MKVINIKDKLVSSIGTKRFNHSIRVVDTAMKLSRMHNVSLKKTHIAAILHDCGRLKEDNKVLEKLKYYGIILDNDTSGNLNLQHSILGRFIASEEFGIEDCDILNAIRFHTTGRRRMTDIEKIIYLADAIEPDREYEGVELIRKIAQVDLDKALLISLEQTLDYLKKNDISINKNTIEAIEWLKK
ncbi:MAG: Metal dependent phosphohydrolase [Clostridiales bacterium 38_11]|nr:MAG: Metal dependent phosphohydrolase [Clostridiales bacterium 38_11]HBH12065.1 phosphohydrolase [Clostridiales bacterium]